MDSGTFIAWQSHMRFTSAEAARQLGKSADTISRYRRNGVPESEARIVALACAAIAMKVPAWDQK